MGASASSSSLASSSSGILTDKEVRKLEKILAREADAEQKLIDAAMKDVKEVEQALSKSTKNTQQAQKLVAKTKEREIAAQKGVAKAQTRLASVQEKGRQAQEAVTAKEQREAGADRAVQQGYADFEDCHRTAEANARDRTMRLSQIRAQHGMDATAPAGSPQP
ncbi:hypothetical protein BD311DRAFT_51149 [Dichomitus squalens]|uniref:Uncharacterized protein n=1 Tax=Dichomitus squalens TaxID=114155 RepID=A0A4Q9MWA6_9APHY|nr:hypothetical protein BD311DRAFT_51149 [Dichomitus squalens]